MENVEWLEKLSKAYLDELGEEIVRLMAVVHPELHQETVEQMVGKLDVGDRLSLCKAYRKSRLTANCRPFHSWRELPRRRTAATRDL